MRPYASLERLKRAASASRQAELRANFVKLRASLTHNGTQNGDKNSDKNGD